MNTTAFVPADHPIVIATRRPLVAKLSAEVLRDAGYPVVVCPEESTGFSVVAIVEEHCPHVLVIDDDIEWAEGVHVVQRLHADPAFARLYILLLLPSPSSDVAQWVWQDGTLGLITLPFPPAELLSFTHRGIETILTEGRLPSPDLTAASRRTGAEWEAWRRQIFPCALIDAAERGNWIRLHTLIASGADIGVQNSCGSTALSAAASTGREDILLFLLEKGAEINTVNSPLRSAAGRARLGAMQLLLQWGADPDTASTDGETPLMHLIQIGERWAGVEKQMNCIRLLMAYGADPNIANAEGETALTLAQQRGLTQAERLLRTEPSQSPADYRIVVAMRHPDRAQQCAQYLLQAGYSVVICPADVDAAIVIATVETYRPNLLICDGDIELKAGAHVVLRLHTDPNFATLDVLLLPDKAAEIPQWTWHDPWPIAAYLTKPFSAFELLGFVRRLHRYHIEQDIMAPAPPPLPHRTEAEWQAWTEALPPFPFFTAAHRGDQAGVERWLAQGVHVDARNNRHWTALHNATYCGHTEVVRLLLQAGATVNLRTITGATPLWYAALHTHTEVMRLLLEYGADPNALRTDRQTILVSALGKGGSDDTRQRRAEAAKLLLEFGADPNALNSNGDTPLSRTTKYAMLDTVGLLRDHGARS